MSWRWRVFVATGLSYTCYYFTRKPFYVAKASLGKALHLDAAALGWLGSLYLLAYAVGQFLAGWAGTRWGPRVLVLWGMALTILCNLAFGLTSLPVVFGLVMVVNGLAQATGWPGNVAAMAPWFRRDERGTVMGFWATNFQIGAGAATFVAAYVLERAHDYRAPFFVGAAVTFGAWLVFLAWQRNRPQDVGLPPIVDEEEQAVERAAWTRDTTVNVAIVGVFYFFVKFVRYALWSWGPYLLETRYGLRGDQAGYLSTVFDWTGIAGVIAAGVLSDRFFRGRRTPICLLFVLAMTASCVLLYGPGSHDLKLFGVSLGLIGFFLFGPDALLAGAGAIDVGSVRQAALAAGIINGMGSFGAVLQEPILGALLDGPGVPAVFACLVASSLGSVGCLLVMTWRNRTGRADL